MDQPDSEMYVRRKETGEEWYVKLSELDEFCQRYKVDLKDIKHYEYRFISCPPVY